MSTSDDQSKRVFISYRRDDSKYQARMIYQSFASVLPSQQLFMDVNSIRPGEDFVEILQGWVDSCDILLALIGPSWMNITDPRTGRRRLDNPYDFVRIEIGEALRRGIPVVPVLLDGTAMPGSDELPDDLKKLPRRQAEFVEYRTFDHDVQRLIAKLMPARAPQTGSVGYTPSGNTNVHVPPAGVQALKPAPESGDIFTDIEGVTPEMVVVPAGEFLMGSPDNEGDRYNDEGPQHTVTISQPFAVGRYPIIFDEWDKALDLGFGGPKLKDIFGRDRQPVINVSWDEAKAYADWLANYSGKPYRLLTEAEWEYACRAGSVTRFSFGDAESELGQYAWYSSNAGWETHPVGAKKPNAFGLYDMHGNVWEWVNDWYGVYQSGPQTDPQGPNTGRSRVYRGGSWDLGARSLRSAGRSDVGPGIRSDNLGFRLARTYD
ncbi:MAG: SUMF1/EgtB/PvdO family nonheme iron enzyme [Pseudomonadota bacterium]